MSIPQKWAQRASSVESALDYYKAAARNLRNASEQGYNDNGRWDDELEEAYNDLIETCAFVADCGYRSPR